MIVAIALYAFVGAVILGWLLCRTAHSRPGDQPPVSMILLLPPFWLAYAIFALLVIISLWAIDGWRGGGRW